jgi:hypothetical protein
LRVSSTATKAVSATIATTDSRTMNIDPNQSSFSPSSSTVSSAPSPMAIEVIPSQSPRRSRSNRRGSPSSET